MWSGRLEASRCERDKGEHGEAVDGWCTWPSRSEERARWSER
jgi:hypothetical protein